jgi:uncharacterized protein YqgC (DUF456 family)
MEAIGDFAGNLGYWTGVSLWVLLLLVANFVILISLPGGWIALGLAVVFDAVTGFSAIGWITLAIFAGLLVVGEVIESLLGMVYVAKKGATRWGIVGGFVGGIVGAILGSGALPVVGTLVGGLAGAFGGAVLGEYLRDQQLEPSLRIGVHATVGKLLATTVKFGLSVAGTVLAVRAALTG